MPTMGFTSVAQLAKIGLPILIICWTLFYVGLSGPNYDKVVRKLHTQPSVFVNDFLENEIDGPFSGNGISKLCAGRKWIPGLVMSCDAATGGVGEVRNAHLHCFRLAIEIGASELILPEIVHRSTSDIKKIIPDAAGPLRGSPLSYFFDVDNLVEMLNSHCPQIKIHQSLNDLYDVPAMLEPVKVTLSDVTQDIINGTVLTKPHEFNQQFHAWFDTKSPPDERKYPIRIHLMPTMYAFPIDTDSPNVARNFGRLLRIRPDARRIAATVLYNLAAQQSLSIDPRVAHTTSGANSSFVGVHLRIERDVVGNSEFPDYATQAADYLNYVTQQDAKVVYLASGADDAAARGGGGGAGAHEDIVAFEKRAAEFGIAVTTKRKLLTGDWLHKLQDLTWDQRALVDYEVMLRAGGFVGPSASSFSWSLALRRAHAYGNGVGQNDNELSTGIQWKDKFSTLFGTVALERTTAKKLTTWP